jgi:hypothetical protein
MPFQKGVDNYSNQFGPWNKSTRDWKSEIVEAAGRLNLCVVLPEKLTASARLKFSCPHGIVKETNVLRFVERQFCCKSQASKAHDPAMKSKAAKVAWDENRLLMLQRQKERWNKPGEKEKHSSICSESIKKLRQKGWSNPGWGWKPGESILSKPAILYWIKYRDADGVHFKVGITMQNLNHRFNSTEIEKVVRTWESDLSRCHNVEQACLKMAYKYGWRYKTDTTTELIRACNAESFQNIINVLWFILPWQAPIFGNLNIT